ncbi:MAG: RNA polymerase factor sigma-54 [Candidatus Omnitrophica bacterium]|nr:RNA polymerase factor sigma-54 [Candidatus Omnitrophota bacterium]
MKIMEYRQRQTIGLTQKLALTTQMRHSVKMLGMSLADLNDYIDTVVSTNPLLETSAPAEDFRFKHGLTMSKRNTALYEAPDDADIAQEITPQESLLSQVRLLSLSEKDIKIAEYLIFEMNGDGYIKVTADEAARDLFCQAEDVERALGAIQSLDPPGIGARDVRECLQLQLERQGKKDSLEYILVTEFLSLVAIQDTLAISRALGADKKEVIKAAERIRALNPRPASTLMAKADIPVVPDLVATVKNDKITLEVNRGAVRKLTLYNPYEDKLGVIKDPKAREFLETHTKEARQLMDNLKRREETLCRVAYHMLKVQAYHIEHEKKYLKALSMADIAKALGLNTSTISRALSNKYIQINGKVSPLKSLTSASFNNSDGKRTSKTYITALIRDLLRDENKTSPMSDIDTMRELEQHGITIKRRTVAKYRESIRILASHLRKRKVFGPDTEPGISVQALPVINEAPESFFGKISL